MGQKKTVEHNGRQVEGEVLEFESKTPENFTQYVCEDGTVIRIKIVLLEVVKLPEYNDRNEPVYRFAAQQIMSTTVPDSLKKKGN